MKTKVLVLTLMLFASVSTTVFANETTSKTFYDRPGAAYLVTAEGVRVRTHPTIDGYIVCELSKGTWVKGFNYNEKPYEDQYGKTWHYILMSDGHVGWVCADFLDLRC